MKDKQFPEPLRIEPALLTILQVCQLLNISRAEFYRLDQNGKFALLSTGLCRKRLYVRAEIEAWIRAGLPHRKLWQPMKKEFMK
jgi:excisionase family DNA binding protein